MACSPAQLASNRRNSLLSTGPRTPEGKARSRRNGLKHGLSGAGIVLPTEDAAEVERRFATLQAEMDPQSELAGELVKRVALMTVRLDRSAEHEAKAISHRMRKASAEFDDARLAEVEEAYDGLARVPATAARRLRNSPEGIARLIRAFEGLKGELVHPYGVRWGWQQCEQFHHLMGCRRVEIPVSRARALGEAFNGDFQYLDPVDGEGLAKKDRQLWAVGQLVELIEAEVAALKALREGFDLEGIELDRAEAPHRAIFDSSKEAILARKYEAAAERGLYRAIREFREAQAEAAAIAETVADHQFEADPGQELASCPPGLSGDEDAAVNVDTMATEVEIAAVEGHDGGPVVGLRADQPTSGGRRRPDLRPRSRRSKR